MIYARVFGYIFFTMLFSTLLGQIFRSFSPKIGSSRLRWVICIGGLLATTFLARADVSTTNAAPQYGPPGDWVKPQFFGQSLAGTVLEAGADQHWLLWERQINVRQNETFCHGVRQILSQDGVQNDTTLTMDFNPNYQSLTLHWVRIWRDGQHLDRLDTNKVRVVQQEQDLDQYLLNGQKSAVLVLDDVRVGDVIDYAYTIKGENPVFGGHFSSMVPVELDQPAERLLTRVIWPNQRRLYAKQHGCTVQPSAIVNKGSLEYTWDFRQMPGFTHEDFLPAWYDPQPWVQLSDFQTWTEVNQWALALFRVTAPVSPDLSRKIAEWKQIADPEQQVLAALRFVQDDVRYFGIEIGDGTEKPAAPATVYARRFGDCKDKSLLFVTILRALGIEAYPVLVNSTLGRAIEDWQPTAGAFDHCIAMVQLAGQTYWLDPTANYQRGPLAAHYLPDYARGLVISPYTTGLTVIPHDNGWPQTTTTEYFQLHGKDEPADLKVVTVAEGRDADDLREQFATTKRSDLERSYTHFYSSLYPGIHLSAPLVMTDDEQQNRVQTTETYTIDKMWTPVENSRKYNCEFYASTMAALLKKPVDTDRTLPLGLNYPEHQILRTEVTLPESWPAKSDQKTVSDPAFTFQKNSRCAGNRLVLNYEYWSQADSVPPDQVSDYLGHVDQSLQALDTSLSW